MENQLRQWPGGNRGQNPSVGGRFGHPPRGPPLRGGEMRGFRQRPPQFMGNQRGPPSMGNQRPGMPPPPYRGGRMPDPRWRNIGPPRFGGERKDAPPPPNMSMRPPQFLPNRPPTAPMPPRPPEFPAPPGINQKELPRNLPPTESTLLFFFYDSNQYLDIKSPNKIFVFLYYLNEHRFFIRPVYFLLSSSQFSVFKLCV